MSVTFMTTHRDAHDWDEPTQKEIDNLRAGDYVKTGVHFPPVCRPPLGHISAERFWTKIVSINGDLITATIDNDLLFSDIHGLFCDEKIKFYKHNILTCKVP